MEQDKKQKIQENNERMTIPEGLHVQTLGMDPTILDQVLELREAGWPEYIKKGASTNLHIEEYVQLFGDYLFILRDERGVAVAYGAAIPLAWDGTIMGLPGGWDAAYEQAFAEHDNGVQANTLCVLGAVVSPSYKGKS